MAVLQDMVEDADDRFQKGYFTLGEWFEHYDALHLLAYCCTYFICHPPGVDPEATGSLDFYPHYLEILQAFSLMQERASSARPLGPVADDLLDLMSDVGRAASLRGFKTMIEGDDGEGSRSRIYLEMRGQTMAVRNPGYPHHIRHIARGLAETIREDFTNSHGVDPVRLVDALFHLPEVAMTRLNQHLQRVSYFYRERTYQEVASSYVESFPDVPEVDADWLFEFTGRSLDAFKAVLVHHADLRLADCFGFTLDDVVDAYGRCADRQAIKRVIDELAFEFGALHDCDKESVILDNPIWERPFIRVDDGMYFSSLVGYIPHYILGLLERFVTADPTLDRKYRGRKARYLEDETERLFREAFPNGEVYRGSMWDDGAGGKGENDLTIILGCVAVVVEAKSGSLSPSAKRGAPERLAHKIKKLIDEPAGQAHRFIRVLKGTPGPHTFATKSGSEHTMDVSEVRYFLPLTVTLEQLGFVSNLRDLAESGISDRKISELAQVVSLTDLEVIFEVLDLQSEKVHFLFRRRELGARTRLHGYEMDVLALYLDRGFNIEDIEFSGDNVMDLRLASKQLDPYFVGEQLGVPVTKPGLRLTPWWTNMLRRLDGGCAQHWLDAALLLLNVPHEDQRKLERQFDKLSDRLRRGKAKGAPTAVVLLTAPAQRRFCIVLYPYLRTEREERDSTIANLLGQDNAQQSRGAVCIGVDIGNGTVPYTVVCLTPESDLFDEL